MPHRNTIKTRRKVLSGIAVALATVPIAALAQERSAVRHLGVLMGALTKEPQGQANAAALLQGLGALGWKQGDNLLIDWRWAGADRALYERYAGELAALGPDVMLASNALAIEALQRHTSTIPIVFATVTDPVGQGFVASLARPGGNITGFTVYDPQMASKWLQLLRQITPPVEHVAVLYNAGANRISNLSLRAIEEAAPAVDMTVRAAPCDDDAQIDATMTATAHEQRGGVLVLGDAFTTLHRDIIVALAAQERLPAVYPYRTFVAAGGLMSYGVDQSDSYRRAAAYIDRILKGTKPSDLPVQNPTKFELVINLKTAKALGISFPTLVLVSADEVIE